mmetsp:Transcript_28451/g.62283  ORF Transcript_28451/g.62283 Transcript_28451/m.62283 type:complete len:204 (+) Transcript_28451:491-1102(+)
MIEHCFTRCLIRNGLCTPSNAGPDAIVELALPEDTLGVGVFAFAVHLVLLKRALVERTIWKCVDAMPVVLIVHKFALVSRIACVSKRAPPVHLIIEPLALVRMPLQGVSIDTLTMSLLRSVLHLPFSLVARSVGEEECPLSFLWLWWQLRLRFRFRLFFLLLLRSHLTAITQSLASTLVQADFRCRQPILVCRARCLVQARLV